MKQIFNQQIGHFSMDISIKDCEAIVKNIEGDISTKSKMTTFVSMVRNWYQFNKIDITRVTLKY